jgi:outer membrane protein assembly factor BamB
MLKRSLIPILSLILLACLLLSGCGSPATASPAATPTLPPTLPPTLQPSPILTTPPSGTLLWTFSADNAVWSSPVVSNGLVFFGSDDKSFYAVDAKTHQQAWKFATGGIIRSRPAVSDGVVFVSSDDGVLHALDVSTGVEKWQTDIGAANIRTGGAFDVGSGYDYQQSSPVIAGGVVYVGSGAAEFDAVDAASGKLLWRFETASRIRSSAAIAAGKVYVGDGSGTLHAFDARTGAELWNQPGCDLPSPAAAGGLVYCGSRGTFEVHAWDAATGELKWKFPVGHSWVDSSPVIVDDILYIGSSDASTLFALDAATGELKWQFSTKGYAWCTPRFANGTVYIGSYNMGVEGTLYAVDAATGQQKWSLTIKGGIVGSPAVDQGVIYIGGLDGNLYSIQE